MKLNSGTAHEKIIKVKKIIEVNNKILKVTYIDRIIEKDLEQDRFSNGEENEEKDFMIRDVEQDEISDGFGNEVMGDLFGNDLLNAQEDNNTIIGTSSIKDTINRDTRKDSISGNQENNNISERDWEFDLVAGGNSNDTLSGSNNGNKLVRKYQYKLNKNLKF